MTPEALPHMTDDELRAFVDDYVSGRLFTSANLAETDVSLLPTIFMPLALGAFDGHDREWLDHVGLLWERLEKCGRWSCNGYPQFFSFHMMRADDWERACNMIDLELDRRRSIELPGDT